MQPTKVNVSTTAILLVAANGMRRSLAIVNRGSADIYLGNSAQVTVGTGIVVRPQESMSAAGDADAYWGIAASGTQPCDVMEVVA